MFVDGIVLENILRSYLLFTLFVVGIFVVLNGPLWVAVHAGVFAGGPQAPVWLHRGVSLASRLAGIAMLGAWAWGATGAIIPTLVVLVVLAAGLFFLSGGFVRLITRSGVFHSGRKAPGWMEHGVSWFTRLVGVGVLFGGLVVGITASAG